MLAAEFKSEVAGVACLSPTLFYDGWNVPWFHRFLSLVDYTPLKYFTYLREGPPYGLKDEVLREKMRRTYETASLSEREAPQTTYAHFPIRLLCECRHLIAQGMTMLPDVRAPVLVVQSANDDSTSPANAAYVLEHVSSQIKRLVLLDNSYHIVTADLEREKVADAMGQFFLEVSGVGAPLGKEEAVPA
jgi:carboxylesterase